jgi:hypothetical protein
MAEKTPAKIIQEALVTILEAGKTGLAVDARVVTVFDHLPQNGFSQKAMPVVVVQRPEKDSEEPWGRDYERRVYTQTIALVDVEGVRPGDEDEVKERLDLLFEKIKKLLAHSSNANLRLPWLHVFWSLCSWDEDQPTPAGNNLMVKPLLLTVPMTIERGKVWDITPPAGPAPEGE